MLGLPSSARDCLHSLLKIASRVTLLKTKQNRSCLISAQNPPVASNLKRSENETHHGLQGPMPSVPSFPVNLSPTLLPLTSPSPATLTTLLFLELTWQASASGLGVWCPCD